MLLFEIILTFCAVTFRDGGGCVRIASEDTFVNVLSMCCHSFQEFKLQILLLAEDLHMSVF